MTIQRASFIASLICFILLLFHVAVPFDLLALGLALLAAGHLA